MTLPFLYFQAPICCSIQFPPCTVPCSPTPYLPSSPCPTMKQRFIGYKIKRACSRLGKPQNGRGADPGNVAWPGGSHPISHWLRVCASGPRWQRHKTAPVRWLDGSHTSWCSVLCTILCNNQPDETLKSHYPLG